MTLPVYSDAVILALIAATTNIILSMVGLIVSVLNNQKLKRVHNEVQTANGLTMAQLSDASETRRINREPIGERTPAEIRHLAVDAATHPREGDIPHTHKTP